jgi:hypothetical protein
VTALGKLFRTTAFKLSIAYLIVFAILAGAVMFWVSADMRRVMDEQVEATIEAEIKGLSDLYRQGGVRRLVDIIERRSRQPGASLYLVTNFQGQAIAGNILDLPAGVLTSPGIRETAYEHLRVARRLSIACGARSGRSRNHCAHFRARASNFIVLDHNHRHDWRSLCCATCAAPCRRHE